MLKAICTEFLSARKFIQPNTSKVGNLMGRSLTTACKDYTGDCLELRTARAAGKCCTCSPLRDVTETDELKQLLSTTTLSPQLAEKLFKTIFEDHKRPDKK